MYSFVKSISSVISSTVCYLYWPLPSYPNVVVFNKPGSKSTFSLKSFSFLTITYFVVVILLSLRNFFSVSRCWMSWLISGFGKTTTLGYDGKGQYKLNTVDDITKEIDFTKEYILEKLIHLKKEISVVITRYDQNSYEIYEPIENVHEEQILKYSTIPSDISDDIRIKSIEWAKHVVEKLDYIGTLCVEFFIDTDDNLYANEIAPRVHNSGHLTMNSHNISQFENHVRAVCGLEKIETKKLYNAKMINLIGDEISPYRNKKFKDNEFFYDYLKTEIKQKRKMGHLTIIEK